MRCCPMCEIVLQAQQATQVCVCMLIFAARSPSLVCTFQRVVYSILLLKTSVGWCEESRICLTGELKEHF
jgi:hypothetical protein